MGPRRAKRSHAQAGVPAGTRDLVRRLRSSNDSEQDSAILQLAMQARMSLMEEAFCRDMVAAGGVPPLVEMVRSGATINHKAIAATTLMAFWTKADAGPALAAEPSAAPALVALLDSSRGVRGTAAQATAATLLWWLAERGAAQREAMVAAGAIPLLVELLGSWDHDTPQVAHDSAARALRVLADHSAQHAAAAVTAGAVPALEECVAACGQDPEVEHAVAEALCVLSSRHADSVSPRGIATLVQLLGRRHQDTALRAAEALRCVSGDDAADAAIVAAGGLPALVQLLGGGGGGDDGGGGDSGGGGGFPSPGLEIETLEVACDVLYNVIISGEAARLAAAEAGAVPALARLLARPYGGDGEGLWEAAGDALRELCDTDDGVTALALLTSGAPGALVQLAAGCSDAQLKVSTMQAASRLVAAANAQMQGFLADHAAVRGQATASDPSAAPAAPAAPQAAAAAPRAAGEPAAAAHTGPSPAPLRAQPVCAAPGCGATRSLKRCGGCGNVRYCSVACSKAHWRAHKAECRRMQAERAAAEEEAGAAAAGGNA